MGKSGLRRLFNFIAGSKFSMMYALNMPTSARNETSCILIMRISFAPPPSLGDGNAVVPPPNEKEEPVDFGETDVVKNKGKR